MITLEECVRACLSNPEFLHHYDRLRGTNISLKGSALDLEIDKASGRLESDVAQFVADVADIVWARLPQAETATARLIPTDKEKTAR